MPLEGSINAPSRNDTLPPDESAAPMAAGEPRAGEVGTYTALPGTPKRSLVLRPKPNLAPADTRQAEKPDDSSSLISADADITVEIAAATVAMVSSFFMTKPFSYFTLSETERATLKNL